MGLEFLKTLVIIFGVSATVVFIVHKFRIPSIVGFLIAGREKRSARPSTSWIDGQTR
jgi:predicted Kef-type K+ transport protein